MPTFMRHFRAGDRLVCAARDRAAETMKADPDTWPDFSTLARAGLELLTDHAAVPDGAVRAALIRASAMERE